MGNTRLITIGLQIKGILAKDAFPDLIFKEFELLPDDSKLSLMYQGCEGF